MSHPNTNVQGENFRGNKTIHLFELEHWTAEWCKNASREGKQLLVEEENEEMEEV